MENLELLADEELRLRLVQYGFPNLPVTQTTRRVLIKKLRTYLENEKSKLRRETSYATRYSSGEESDNNDVRGKAKAGGRKAQNRSSVPVMQQSNVTYKPSMPPPLPRTRDRSTISNSNITVNKTPSSQTRNSSVYVSPVIINDSEDEQDFASKTVHDKNNFGSKPTPKTFQRPASSTTETPISAYKRFSYTTPNASTNSLDDSANGNATNSSPDSPAITEYKKRLLQLREETVNNENINHNTTHQYLRNRASTAGNTVYIRPNNLNSVGHFNNNNSNSQNNTSYEFNENDIVTHADPDLEPPHIPLRVAIGNLVNKLDEHYGFKQTFIPCFLLFMFITFLVFVAVLYLTISPDINSTLNSIDTKYVLCEPNQIDKRDHCIEKIDLNSALELLKITARELQRRVEYSLCTDSSASYIMSANDVLDFAYENMNPSEVWQLMRVLHNMEYLIANNPQWRIDHVNGEGIPITFEDVIAKRTSKSNYLAILKPKLPLKCMLYRKFHTFFVIVGVLGVVGILTYLSNSFIQFVIYVKQKRTERVNHIINEITSAVMDQAAKAQNNPSESALVIVNHLRDSLIAPQDRKQLEAVWIEAIKYLENNESRLLFEVRNKGGEDYKMMRWVDAVVPGSSLQSGSGQQVKKWQSPAFFDKTNKIKDPPTPCLKIRQMFDKYEVNDPNLKTVVQNAILEKVGPTCKIFDIQLDRNTCCVYVRCATNADAGIVHNEINGWWFDKRLVSIKFLRIERYLSRFPNSPAGPKCLKPSNKNNSSMSEQKNGHDEDDDDDDLDDEE